MVDWKSKFLKYKKKYENLNQIGGSNRQLETQQIKNKRRSNKITKSMNKSEFKKNTLLRMFGLLLLTTPSSASWVDLHNNVNSTALSQHHMKYSPHREIVNQNPLNIEKHKDINIIGQPVPLELYNKNKIVYRGTGISKRPLSKGFESRRKAKRDKYQDMIIGPITDVYKHQNPATITNIFYDALRFLFNFNNFFAYAKGSDFISTTVDFRTALKFSQLSGNGLIWIIDLPENAGIDLTKEKYESMIENSPYFDLYETNFDEFEIAVVSHIPVENIKGYYKTENILDALESIEKFGGVAERDGIFLKALEDNNVKFYNNPQYQQYNDLVSKFATVNSTSTKSIREQNRTKIKINENIAKKKIKEIGIKNKKEKDYRETYRGKIGSLTGLWGGMEDTT